MRAKLSLAFLYLAFNSAIAAERSFDFVQDGISRVIYENGTPYLQANTNNVGLTVSFIPDEKNRGWIGIQITNFSDSAITVSEKSLSAASNGKPLRVYTYSELMAEQKRRDSWRRFGAAMTASTSPSPYSTQSGTYSSNTNASVYGSNGYSAYGSANTYGTYQSSSYDATAAAINQAEINRRNDAMMANLRARSNSEKSVIDNRALRANTLQRGESLYGEVNFDLPKKSRGNPPVINVTITIGGEQVKVALQEQ
ncbi:MAG: hypothetical protein IT474_01845 [Arenimonas sp.]|nr:hypothetical protein [Arenimonas sp.]